MIYLKLWIKKIFIYNCIHILEYFVVLSGVDIQNQAAIAISGNSGIGIDKPLLIVLSITSEGDNIPPIYTLFPFYIYTFPKIKSYVLFLV